MHPGSDEKHSGVRHQDRHLRRLTVDGWTMLVWSLKVEVGIYLTAATDK